MKIEISDIFLKENDDRKSIEIQLKEPKKIIEILEELEIENLGYADFYLNDIKVKKNATAENYDKLTVLPTIGGG